MVPAGFVSNKAKAAKSAAKKPAKPAQKAAAPIEKGLVHRKPKTAVDPARGARPVHVPSAELRKQVEQYAGLGNSVEGIALIVRLSVDTLRAYYADELSRGPELANSRVSAAMFNKAVKGDVNAGKFWLGSRAGWKPGLAGGLGEGGITIHISADDAQL